MNDRQRLSVWSDLSLIQGYLGPVTGKNRSMMWVGRPEEPFAIPLRVDVTHESVGQLAVQDGTGRTLVLSTEDRSDKW